MKSVSFVVLSEQLYRRLLILYPPRFRHEYGREMAIVFRSQCQNLVLRDGEAALARLWLATLGDLIATAMVERIKEGLSMSKISISKVMWIQLSGIIAFVGGILGLYLLTLGPNEYGNFGWHGQLTTMAIILLAVGFVGWFTAYHQQMDARGWLGLVICVGGLLSMAVGYLIDDLWFLTFIGPTILVPIGAILLSISSSRIKPLPAWWRYFPWVVAAIGLVGFGIEMWEEAIQNSTPDRGLQMAQFLFSVVWLGLGIGLWLDSKRSTSLPGVM